MGILRRNLFLILTITFLGGCSLHNYIQNTNQFISTQKLTKDLISTNMFDIVTFTQNSLTSDTLRIYIEGDGMAWISRYKPSNDPTPANPIALKLMLKDKYSNTLYIARPCQYLQENEKRNCTKEYWTNKRFSKEVVESMDDVINYYQKRYEFKKIELIGYSGGGAIALLVSSFRDDISKVVTVAGNLDPDYWTNYHKVSSLDGLNPVDYVDKLKDIKQIHLIGEKDKIIDKSIFNSYLQKTSKKENIENRIYSNFTHHKGWIENWSKILDSID